MVTQHEKKGLSRKATRLSSKAAESGAICKTHVSRCTIIVPSSYSVQLGIGKLLYSYRCYIYPIVI